MTKRVNEGFTLVELLVSILAASIVTLAACTVLLLGVRINAQSTGVVTRQNTARVFMTALENMAAEGVIFGTETYEGNWKVLDEEGNAVLSYKKDDGEISAKSGVLLKNVDSSTVAMKDSGLLTCTVETADGVYELSVYCRTVDTAKTEARNAKRNAFLQTLVSQFLPMDSPNEGHIIGGDDDGVGYAQWYGWSEDTPWCACFVSWGLTESGVKIPEGTDKWFGEVNNLRSYFAGAEEAEDEDWRLAKSKGGTYIPVPGDLIFFRDGEDDHVGAVISVAGGYVYTIEGNVKVTIPNEDNQPESGTDTEPGTETDTESDTKTIYIVQLKKYELSDNTILGYGVLNWD